MLFLLRPRWLALHAFVIASGVAMVFLGRWQWHVAGQRHGDIRNYAYAVQWWLFVVFAVAFWARVVRDTRWPRSSADQRTAGPEAHRPAIQSGPAAAQYQAYAMPQSGAIVVEDPQLVAYNAYLAAIAQPVHIEAGDTHPAPSARAAQSPRTPPGSAKGGR